jgi:hypothetical protein
LTEGEGISEKAVGIIRITQIPDRVPPAAPVNWQIVAGLMGIPCNRFTYFILGDWAENHQKLLRDDGRFEDDDFLNDLSRSSVSSG